MTAEHNYWKECIEMAAEECNLSLTPEQLECLATAAEDGNNFYNTAFYAPPPSDRLSVIENEWRERLKVMQSEYDQYRSDAEDAIKKALGVSPEGNISVGSNGEVLHHEGRTVRVQ